MSPVSRNSPRDAGLRDDVAALDDAALDDDARLERNQKVREEAHVHGEVQGLDGREGAAVGPLEAELVGRDDEAEHEHLRRKRPVERPVPQKLARSRRRRFG